MKARRYAIALAAMTLGLAMLASAGVAAPDSPDGEAGPGSSLSTAEAGTEPAQPPNLPRIADDQRAQEIGFKDIAQVVDRQKLKIKLPPQTFMTFAETCVEAFPGFYFTTPRDGVTVFSCPRAEKQLAEYAALIPEEAWNGLLGGQGLSAINGDSWVQSPAGSERPFGTFAPVRVRALAFGSVPITATVHISQHMRDGLVQPLNLQWGGTAGWMPEGIVIPGYGPSPGYPYAFTPPAKFDGPLDIRLSDVEVDGVPLPVGSGCVAPADLTMNPRPGYYRIDYVEHPPVKGMPGEFQPLSDIASYLSGTVDIKAFSGCQNGAETLDPLLTGMISGPGNAIDTTQIRAMRGWCGADESGAGTPPFGKVYCDINDTPFEGQPAALRKMGLRATTQAAPAGAKQPTASQLRKLRSMDTKRMSEPVRKLWKTMMKSLPPAPAAR